MSLPTKSLVSSVSVYQLGFADNFPEGSGTFSSFNETMFENSGVDQCFSVLVIQIIKYYFPAITWRDRIKQCVTKILPIVGAGRATRVFMLPCHFTTRSAHSLSSYVFTLHTEVS